MIEKRNHKYKDELIDTFNNGITRIDINKYVFVSKEHNWIIPFRFNKSLEYNKPLFIYVCGSATMGRKNILNKVEANIKYVTKKIEKYDCNILLPQFIYTKDYFSKVETFSDTLAQLVNELCLEFEIDKSRIYLVGTSLGGYVVWNSLINHSDIYAGAVSVVGGINNYEEINKKQIKNISKVPLWIAHSENDRNVKIDSDDYIYHKLEEIGKKPIYTRWNKYAHKMSNIFYKKEPWEEWLFKQKRL